MSDLTREQIDNWRACFRAAFKHNPFDRPQIDALCDMALRSLDVGQAPKSDVHLASTLSERSTENISQWTAVNDRRPGPREWCLVRDAEGETRIALYVHQEFAGQIVHPVAHWMPLPPPPDVRDALKTAPEPNEQNTAAVPNEVSVSVLEAERKALEKAEQICKEVMREAEAQGAANCAALIRAQRTGGGVSTRTVIEINHDYLHDIARDPEKLTEFVMRLGSGLEWAEKRIPNGMRVLGQRHHSKTLKLKVK